MQLAIAIVLFGFLGYAGYTLYTNYRGSTQTGWHRYLDAAEGSATILWAKVSMIVASLAGGLASIADYFNEPTVGAAIQKYMTPTTASALGIIFAVVTIWARKRTL